MPTPAGVAVLEDMRRQQVALARTTIQVALAAWPLLFRDDDQARWLAVMIALIRRDRRVSAEIARRYLMAYRVVERVPGDFAPELPGDLNEEQIITSLMVTGPRALEREAKRMGLPRVPNQAGIATKIMESNARAAQRHVLNGGREVVDDVLRRDPERRGYMRLTDGDPCYFCAMLASRGPVYEEDSFDDSDPRFQGAGDHKVHDGCGCTLVPIYGSGVNALTQFKKYERLWQESGQKASGAEAIRSFRRAYEGR